jgi:rfaE bifunctional protein kinase chain/domain/rfaE bifunctional protein nucleotidyltransferase chain/domain
MKKILDKKSFTKIINKLRDSKKIIVLCHGVFDVVHYGHIMHFKSAKKFGDVLIVSISRDKFIKKGMGRPLFNEVQRLKYLSEIEVIDYLYVCETDSAADSIKIIKPNYYVKGPDYKNNLLDNTKKIFLEKKLVNKFKGKIIYTEDEKFSSSVIINEKNLLNFDSEQDNYIKKIKNKFSYNYIKNKILNFKKLKPLLIGELIFDHYCFGNIIGKSGKEPHLVLKEINNEFYVGGAGAVARHLSSFVHSVQMISPFGNENFFKQIIRKSFGNNIVKNFLKPEENYSSIIKKRFIDKVSNYKMFGSYILPEKPSKKFSEILISKIKTRIKNSDMIIICDYGHDFLDKKSANFISKLKKFKALNAQLNSANVGYHSVNNYKNIDALVINEAELRQELREERLNLSILAQTLIRRNKIKNLIVTRGKNGATLFRKDSKELSCPAFAHQSVDKVGAGDAMLAISALAVKQNLEPELVLFLGSIAAAICVKTIGNKISVDIDELDKIIQYILK